MTDKLAKVGDTVKITRLNGYDIEHTAAIIDIVSGGTLAVIEPAYYFYDERFEEDFLELDDEDDEYYIVKHPLYDDEQIADSFVEAAAKGKSLSECTGVAFLAEGLDFKSNEQQALESITPESLAFEEPTKDVVNHPSHYNTGKFETIELIEEVTKGYDDGFIAYCVGNTIKYLSRAPYKHGEPTEDIRKAAKYLEFALKRLENG